MPAEKHEFAPKRGRPSRSVLRVQQLLSAPLCRQGQRGAEAGGGSSQDVKLEEVKQSPVKKEEEEELQDCPRRNRASLP